MFFRPTFICSCHGLNLPLYLSDKARSMIKHFLALCNFHFKLRDTNIPSISPGRDYPLSSQITATFPSLDLFGISQGNRFLSSPQPHARMFAPPPNQIIIALSCNPTLTEFLFQSGAGLFGEIVLHIRSRAPIPSPGGN